MCIPCSWPSSWRCLSHRWLWLYPWWWVYWSIKFNMKHQRFKGETGYIITYPIIQCHSREIKVSQFSSAIRSGSFEGSKDINVEDYGPNYSVGSGTCHRWWCPGPLVSTCSLPDDFREACLTLHLKIPVITVEVIGVTNFEGVRVKEGSRSYFITWAVYSTHWINPAHTS